MTPEEITLYQEIARELDECAYGKKSAYMKEKSESIGISRDTLYNNLGAVGYISGKKLRTDKGNTHIDLEDARLVCAIMTHTARKNEKRLTSCDRAIEIAFANGEIKQKYNPSTLLRVAKEHGFHPDQQGRDTPHVEMKSLHPNHVWQVDASVGTLFYLPKGGVEFFDEREHYKNKPQNLEKVRNDLCVRYVITDHNSGSIFVKYYSCSGESQEILFDVLVEGFSKKDKVLMHGVPQILIMDKGSANIAHTVKAFLTKMHVDHFPHSTGNSRAKGSVEKAQDIVECQFEGGLRLMKQPVQNVDELNFLAKKWMVYFNSTQEHSRHHSTRWGLWQTIQPEQLRLAPSREIMQALLTSKPESRTVDGKLRITYKGKGFAQRETYSIAHIPNVRVGEKVMVTVNPYRAPNIDIIMTDYQGKETLHECVPLAFDEAGFSENAVVFGEEMARTVDTVLDSERKESLRAAYAGAETLTEAKAQQKKGVQLFGGKIDPFKHMDDKKIPLFIERPGTEMDIAAPRQVLEPISIAEAAKRIKAEMGDTYPADGYTRIKAQYGDSIDPMDIPAVIEFLTAADHLKIVKTA